MQRNTVLRVRAEVRMGQTATLVLPPRASALGVKAKVPVWLRSLNYPLIVPHTQCHSVAHFLLACPELLMLVCESLFCCSWLLCFYMSFENLCSACFSVDPLHFPSPHLAFPPSSSPPNFLSSPFLFPSPFFPILTSLSLPSFLLSLVRFTLKLQIQIFLSEFLFILSMLGFLVPGIWEVKFARNTSPLSSFILMMPVHSKPTISSH